VRAKFQALGSSPSGGATSTYASIITRFSILAFTMSSNSADHFKNDQYAEQIRLVCAECNAVIADRKSQIAALQREIEVNEISLAAFEKSLSLYVSSASISGESVDSFAHASNDSAPKEAKPLLPPQAPSDGDASPPMQERQPSDMLLPRFRGKTLNEVVYIILSEASEALKGSEVAERAYETRNDEEFIRARNSIASTIRDGAGKKGWSQLGRGVFMIDKPHEQQQDLLEVS
jgi:hypothetical protein